MITVGQFSFESPAGSLPRHDPERQTQPKSIRAVRDRTLAVTRLSPDRTEPDIVRRAYLRSATLSLLGAPGFEP